MMVEGAKSRRPTVVTRRASRPEPSRAGQDPGCGSRLDRQGDRRAARGVRVYNPCRVEALAHWLSLDNVTVRVGGASDQDPDLVARGTAFHPKVYAFEIGNRTCNVLVASANLTSRGFTVNTEAGWSERAVAVSHVEAAFSELSRESRLLTPHLLEAYRQQRQSRPPQAPNTEGTLVPAFSPSGPLPSFRDVVESGSVDLAAHNAMWVHADAPRRLAEPTRTTPWRTSLLRRGLRTIRSSEQPHHRSDQTSSRVADLVRTTADLAWQQPHGTIQSPDPEPRRSELRGFGRPVPAPTRWHI